jgi:predicted membrane-bound mannosyltransferase
LLATLAALAVAAVFYSSFGRHFAGLYDAGAAYGRAWTRATGDTDHEKPWWYYLRLFAGQRTGGLVWEQTVFSLLAVAGFLSAFATGNKFARRAACYAALVGVALSLTPYKTPWHVVHLVPPLAVLAASALARIPYRAAGVGLAALALTFQVRQPWLAAFLRPADARNPYAYVHSSPDVMKIRPLVASALAHRPGRPVRIVGEEYWPLPWYLRGLPDVGYWSTLPETCDGALVVSTLAQSELVRARLHGPYDESFLGLRPEVICVLFTPRP